MLEWSQCHDWGIVGKLLESYCTINYSHPILDVTFRVNCETLISPHSACPGGPKRKCFKNRRKIFAFKQHRIVRGGSEAKPRALPGCSSWSNRASATV